MLTVCVEQRYNECKCQQKKKAEPHPPQYASNKGLQSTQSCSIIGVPPSASELLFLSVISFRERVESR